MKKALVVGAMALTVLGVSTAAQAAPLVTMLVCQTGFGCTTRPDVDPDPTVFNAISFTFGDYHVTSSSGTGLEGTFASAASQTNLAVHRQDDTFASPLEVYLISSNFATPTGSPLTMDTSLSSTSTASTGAISFTAWFSNTNSTAVPPTGTTSGNIMCIPVGGFPGSCSINGPSVQVIGGTPFSLISRITFTIPQFEFGVGPTNSYEASGVVTVTAVPEPGSMLLLGTGLLGLAATVRRRMAKR